MGDKGLENTDFDDFSLLVKAKAVSARGGFVDIYSFAESLGYIQGQGHVFNRKYSCAGKSFINDHCVYDQEPDDFELKRDFRLDIEAMVDLVSFEVKYLDKKEGVHKFGVRTNKIFNRALSNFSKGK